MHMCVCVCVKLKRWHHFEKQLDSSEERSFGLFMILSERDRIASIKNDWVAKNIGRWIVLGSPLRLRILKIRFVTSIKMPTRLNIEKVGRNRRVLRLC